VGGEIGRCVGCRVGGEIGRCSQALSLVGIR